MSYTKYPLEITENRIQFSINAAPGITPAKDTPKEFIVEWLDSIKNRTIIGIKISQTKIDLSAEDPNNTDSIASTYKIYDANSTTKPYILDETIANQAFAFTYFPFSKFANPNEFEKYYNLKVTLSDGVIFEYLIYTFYRNGNPITMGDANKPIGG
jgi:hypothetical protein